MGRQAPNPVCHRLHRAVEALRRIPCCRREESIELRLRRTAPGRRARGWRGGFAQEKRAKGWRGGFAQGKRAKGWSGGFAQGRCLAP
jgi:hypothetical protein